MSVKLRCCFFKGNSRCHELKLRSKDSVVRALQLASRLQPEASALAENELCGEAGRRAIAGRICLPMTSAPSAFPRKLTVQNLGLMIFEKALRSRNHAILSFWRLFESHSSRQHLVRTVHRRLASPIVLARVDNGKHLSPQMALRAGSLWPDFCPPLPRLGSEDAKRSTRAKHRFSFRPTVL